MVYLYAGMGVVMLTGIMAIFEMGLSLTGQSLLPMPTDPYFADSSMKESDVTLLSSLFDAETFLVDEKTFPELADEDLCAALNKLKDEEWLNQLNGEIWSELKEISFWNGSCQLNRSRGLHRFIIKDDSGNKQMPYRLFSCDLSGKNIWYDNELEIYRCSFERV